MKFLYNLFTWPVQCRRWSALMLLLCAGEYAGAQASFAPYEALFTEPKSYVAAYTDAPIAIDGKLDEAAWKVAAWTDLFVDIEGAKKPKPLHATRVKMTYNDSFLFVAAYLEEPHVWATLKKRDTIIYHDNDFEVFVSPSNNGHQYYEVEVNAFNTILDLMMPKPYRNGASAMIGYDVSDLQSAVQVHGTLNNSADKDEGWTVEMAIPFRSIVAGNTWRTPAEGAIWRINFSRVHWQTDMVNGRYVRKKDSKGKLLPEYNWVWSPQGVIDMHYPERWGYLQFTRKATTVFTMPYNEQRRPHLWLVYYRQKAFYQKHGKYANSLQDLNIATPDVVVNGQPNKLSIEATSRQFIASITDQHSTITLNNDGLVQQTAKPL
ncbi:carbohydrate-binding family 9-like protein [Pseudocnuella soli]|uniref:carbohydrate-binding family 9-like protein n=1 Tax=Pseudocnuella soli TaxID=2502779 RepID=UPI0014047D9F|nr:carbohydrate-binding family 9-like protein [Pseudocnuella soli]